MPVLHEQHVAPFVLNAITLRGIGSYIHGARLEIRPLTILCGKNGTGKSTWMRVLETIRSALDRQLFPYALHDNDEVADLRFTNAFHYYGFPDDHSQFIQPADHATGSRDASWLFFAQCNSPADAACGRKILT
jgi:hypothetical protein